MSEEEARYRALASSGATLIAFIGFCHEVAGHIIFPWGPKLLGGPVGWHATGLIAIALGLGLLGGTLRLFRFPVVPVSMLAAAAAIFFLVAAAVLHGDFHAFALAGFVAAIVTAYCHQAAQKTS